MIRRGHRRDTRRPASCRRYWSGSPRSILLGMLGVLAVVAALTAAGWLDPGLAPARAAVDTGAQKVVMFEDATVGAGQVWDNVVVVGGDLLVEGTVTNVVVVVGGDVTLTSTGRVGTGGRPGDTALVSVFGDVTIERGARVQGETVDLGGGWAVATTGSAGDILLRPWRTGAILQWVWSTIFLAVAALVAAAIAPRQLAYVSNRVRRRFFSSLGWGALGAIVVVPVVTVVLIVTIIGILLVFPWLFIAVPLMSLFGFIAVGAMVGRLLLREGQPTRGAMMLAAVLGVVIINLARWIPVAGVIILGLLLLIGFGATYVSIWVWLRDRGRRRKELAASEGPGWTGPPPTVPPTAPPAMPSAPPATWTAAPPPSSGGSSPPSPGSG